MLQDSNQIFSTLNSQQKFEIIFLSMSWTLPCEKNIKKWTKMWSCCFPPGFFAKRNAGVVRSHQVVHLASSCLKQGSSRMSCHPPKAFFIASRISFFITFRAGAATSHDLNFLKSRGSHGKPYGCWTKNRSFPPKSIPWKIGGFSHYKPTTLSGGFQKDFGNPHILIRVITGFHPQAQTSMFTR